MDMHLWESKIPILSYHTFSKKIFHILPLCPPLVESERDALLAAAEAVVVGGAARRVEAHVPLRVANLMEKRINLILFLFKCRDTGG